MRESHLSGEGVCSCQDVVYGVVYQLSCVESCSFIATLVDYKMNAELN